MEQVPHQAPLITNTQMITRTPYQWTTGFIPAIHVLTQHSTQW